MGFNYETEIKKIKKACPSARFGPAAGQDLAYLINTGYPESVLSFYREYEPEVCIDFCRAMVRPIAELRTENEEYTPGYLISALGYKVIGTTLYGDVYCINLNKTTQSGDFEVALAGHEEIYEGLDAKEIKNFIIPIAASFHDFLKKFAGGELPVNYYDFQNDDTD